MSGFYFISEPVLGQNSRKRRRIPLLDEYIVNIFKGQYAAAFLLEYKLDRNGRKMEGAIVQ